MTARSHGRHDLHVLPPWRWIGATVRESGHSEEEVHMKDARVRGALIVVMIVVVLIVGKWLVGLLWPGPTADMYLGPSCALVHCAN
jgi:hypothetical protein